MRKSDAGSIYACPLHGNSYTESLYADVQRIGVDVREAVWSGRWLLSNLRAGDTLHMHWPSFHYYVPTSRIRTATALCRFVVLLLWLRARGVRIVWTVHNLYPHDGGKGVAVHRFVRWFLVRIAYRVFVHGPTAAAIVRDEFKIDDEKLRIVPHGNWIGTYPNTVGRLEARQRLELPESGHVFLFIGLCKPYKGLDALIDAMARLETGSILVIAGKFASASYQSALSERAERVGPQKVLIRPGFVDYRDLQVFLNAADTVVLPYREILTSGAAMLAMSFGRPVVAPRLGSLGELVKDGCGILYDRDDLNGLLDALRAARSTRFSEDVILAAAAAYKWEDSARALIEAHTGRETCPANAGAVTLPETE
jgi:beta-1,4-mannosyltransferase